MYFVALFEHVIDTKLAGDASLFAAPFKALSSS